MKVKRVFWVFLFIVVTSFSAFAMSEGEWRKKQADVVKVVRWLIQVGTRYPAYRCGLYVPNVGVCYMKVTAVNMPPEEVSVTGQPAGPFIADVAEVIQVAKRVGAYHILEKDETLYMQSRFMNKVYLRVLPEKLVSKIAKAKKKYLFHYTKMMEDLKTYVDGKYQEDKIDVWVSMTTERFSKRQLPLKRIYEEGMILPNKVIVLYRRYPFLYKKKGEKALADKLYEILKDGKELSDYYGDYELAVGVESGGQLLFVQYPIKSLGSLKRKNLQYFKFR